MTDYESLLMETVLTEQRAIAADIVAIKMTLAEQRGMRRAAIWAAGSIGGFASLVLAAALDFLKARLLGG